MSILLTSGQDQLIGILKTWYDNWHSGLRIGNHPQWISYSGAAGTGKTTVLKYFIEALGLGPHEYIACAYVGKAVLQLQRNQLDAKTIHSLIYNVFMSYTKEGKMKLQFVLKDKLEFPYRLIIVDEATMVNDEMRDLLLSFGIPIIFLGDKNQLPPVFGISSVMNFPDFTLYDIMRQKENDPIVQLSQMVLKGIPLFEGKYGRCEVVRNYEMTSDVLDNYDQILCMTNQLRSNINNKIRYDFKGYTSPEPRLFDKVICRQNNWGLNVDGYSLTNGLTGIITDISRHKLGSGIYIINFHPDFLPEDKEFIGLEVTAKHLVGDYEYQKLSNFTAHEKFEYAYAITVHLSQGSEYNRVLFFDQWFNNAELTRSAEYTAITRAKEMISIVKSTNDIYSRRRVF